MANPAQKAIQNLNRAKAAFLKGETIRPLVAVAETLKIVLTTKVPSSEMGKIASLLRENIQNINKLDAVKARSKTPFAYKPGAEKAVLAGLIPLIKSIHADKKTEKMDATRKRKLQIDHAIIHGSNAVQAGKFDEAKKYFREAANLHVDEDAMFLIIADKLQGAEAFKESFEYLRLALMVNPGDRKACEMVVLASVKIANVDRGLTLLKKVAKKKGNAAHLSYAQAQLVAKKKLWGEAEKLAQEALGQDDSLLDVQKFLRKVAAKAAKAKG